jgi:MFS family permease
MNWNARVSLAFTFFASLSRSVFGGSLIANYVYLLTASDTRVGLVTGAMGLSNVLVAPFAGAAADRYRRDGVLRAAAALSLVALVLAVLALSPVVAHTHQFSALLVAYTMWGMVTGSYNPALLAIFADSVEAGRRSKLYTWRQALVQLASATGPLVSVVMFACLGDEWALGPCRLVLLVGLGLWLPAGALLLMFRDEQSLGSQSDVVAVAAAGGKEPLLGAPAPASSPKPSRFVPGIVALNDTLSGLASGMTFRFFPIWFQDNLAFSPMVTCALFAVSPLCTAALGFAARRASLKLGRVHVALAAKLTGICLLFLIVMLERQWVPLRGWLAALWVARTAIMNSTKALTKSVMMDFLPKRERGRWGALESLTMFGWSGSAAFGGWLVDRHGMRTTFAVTATLQALAALPLVTLLSRVPLEIKT